MPYRPETRDPSDIRADAIAHAIRLLLQDDGYSDVEALVLLYDTPTALLGRVWMRLPLHCRALLVAQIAVATDVPPDLASFLIAHAFNLPSATAPPQPQA